MLLTVCHVLRYAPFYRTLKEIVDQKKIGDIVSIQWNENVGHWHQAHSFVRGNWRNKSESSSMILQKCCHDMDVLQWLVGAECEKISSFGSLTHLNPNMHLRVRRYVVQMVVKLRETANILL